VYFDVVGEVVIRYSSSVDTGDEIEVEWDSTTATVDVKKSYDPIRREI
jgi:ribosomal 50S subunit-recycling heat shock protein